MQPEGNSAAGISSVKHHALVACVSYLLIHLVWSSDMLMHIQNLRLSKNAICYSLGTSPVLRLDGRQKNYM